MSDWKAYSRFGQNEIINAGIDMVMAVDGDLDGFQEGVKAGVLNGSISEERINDAVRRILRQKFRFELFQNPFPDKGLIQKIGTPKHRAIARQAVRKSLVLLKNQNQALPLKRTSRIVVVGKFADNSGLQSGGWTVNWQGMTENYSGATTILEGIRKFALHEVKYDPDGTAAIEDVDVAVIVVGENPYAEFFGDVGGEMNLFQLTLTEEHQLLVQSYSQKGIKTVLVLISGRPLVITPQLELSDAFVAAWLPGSEGDGIAEVLFGFFLILRGNSPTLGPNQWKISMENMVQTIGKAPLNRFFPIGFGLCYHLEK